MIAEGDSDMEKNRLPFFLSVGIVLVASGVLAVSLFAGQRSKKDPPAPVVSTPAHPAIAASLAVVAPRVSASKYVIGPEDVLSIDVWHEPEISQVEAVRPDGKITLPLVGTIRASGETPGALGAEITQKLSAYIQKPHVAVIVREARSQRFYIIGDVLRPGTYSLGAPMNVLDAIAIAGGFIEFAKTSGIYIVRRLPDGHSERIRFNYKAAIRGERRYLNIELRPGDTIIVP